MSAIPFLLLETASIRHEDNRGYLEVLYEQGHVVLKRSFSKAAVFRGMHWQRPPHNQTKLIRVTSGRVLDFVLDSAEFPARICRRELTPAEGWVQVDAHLAHGFYAIEETQFEYLCIGAYNESSEENYSIVDFLKSKLRLSKLILSAKDASATPIDVVDGGLCN